MAMKGAKAGPQESMLPSPRKFTPITDKDAVILREAPDNDGGVVGALRAGEAALFDRSCGEWFRTAQPIAADGKPGWARAAFLVPAVN